MNLPEYVIIQWDWKEPAPLYDLSLAAQRGLVFFNEPPADSDSYVVICTKMKLTKSQMLSILKDETLFHNWRKLTATSRRRLCKLCSGHAVNVKKAKKSTKRAFNLKNDARSHSARYLAALVVGECSV